MTQQQSLDHGGFVVEERVPVRASRLEGYQCFCGGLLYDVESSETGTTYVCFGGHGWLFYPRWGFDGNERWVSSDAVYHKIAAEARLASGDGPALVA